MNLKNFALITTVIAMSGCTAKTFKYESLENQSVTPAQVVQSENTVVFTEEPLHFKVSKLISADNFYEKRKNLIALEIRGYADEKRAPYPGAVTKSIQCDPTYVAKEMTFTSPGQNIWGHYIYSSGRNALGACTKEAVVEKVFWGLIQCEGKMEFYELTVSFPLAQQTIDDKIQKFKCL